MNSAESIFHILVVLCFHPQEVPPQRFGQIYRQHGNAVFAAFCVAHRYLRELEIKIFDSQSHTLHQAQATGALAHGSEVDEANGPISI